MMTASVKENNENTNTPDQILENGGLWQGRLFRFKELKSTNKWALQHLDFCRNGDVVWALHQTEGRGRLSRTWWSSAKKGLTFSVVLTEFVKSESMPILSQIAALAVRNTLEVYAIFGSLKWPNDVLVNGKKIAGILSEIDFNRKFMVLGIGLNVNLNKDDIESGCLKWPATSMLMEKGCPFDIDGVRKSLITELEKEIGRFTLKGVSYVVNTWGKYDWLEGNWIGVRGTEGTVRGKYAGLDEQGRLQIVDQNGQKKIFWAGDVVKIVEV